MVSELGHDSSGLVGAKVPCGQRVAQGGLSCQFAGRMTSDDANWTALTALKGTYDAFRDNYGPFIATGMIWLLPVVILETMGVNGRVLLALEFLIGGLLLTGLAPSVAESLLGHPVPLRDCLVTTVTRLRPGSPVLAAVLLLAVAGALMLFVLPGIYLAAAWSVAAPAMTAEKLGVTAALRRSMILTRGRLLRVGGTVVLYTIIVFFLVMGGKILGVTMDGADSSGWTRVVGFIVDAIVLALTPCLTTCLYGLLRFDKEGITLELVTDTLH
jgi:hypothetical protein